MGNKSNLGVCAALCYCACEERSKKACARKQTQRSLFAKGTCLLRSDNCYQCAYFLRRKAASASSASAAIAGSGKTSKVAAPPLIVPPVNLPFEPVIT